MKKKSVQPKMSVQRMNILSKAALKLFRPYRALGSKNYYTYVNEPSMPIPNKDPCYVKSSEEALEAAGLSSGQL